MKIAISYPPIESDKGVPLLAQNRQFQYFHSPTYIYPMVPASAATLLKQNGYEVFWDDGIAEELSYEEWLARIIQEKPDIIAIETKTPVIKRHWQIIDQLKVQSLKCKVVLMGDHVTALPEESLQNSQVDWVLTGGDFDFMLLNLANHLAKGEALEPGWYYRSEKFPEGEQAPYGAGKVQSSKLENTGPFQLKHNLDVLPMIDRDLTKWKLYAFKNGNYKKTPGTYIMSARDCFWGKCSFCSWTTIFPGKYCRARSSKLMLDEVGNLIGRGVKEIFDDSGTLPVGNWLKEFCEGIIERGYNQEIDFGCNMRFGACSLEDYKLMKKAGFRMLLFGLESANQETLDKINKNLKVEQIIDSCKKAKQAGLSPHLTIMVGFPEETKKDAFKTVELGKNLLRNGFADTLQATLIIPYPGTALFKEAKERDWLRTLDWNRYDMREPILETGMRDDDLKQLIQEIYKVAFDPKFIIKKLVSIRNLGDVRFIFRGIRKVLGHLKDFRS